MKGKYLINTNEWFTAPDGKNYKAVWGDVEIVNDSILGVKTNRMSANWFAKVGSEESHVIIAGCQIHYAVKCKERPSQGMAEDWTADVNKVNIYQRPNNIYIP